MTTEKRLSKRNILVSTAVLASLMVFTVTATEAADSNTDRLQRKVKVMQRVIDEVLLQSEHVRVSPGGVTRGLVLEEYGVLFTFDASVGEGLMFVESFPPDVALFYRDPTDLRSETRVPEPDKRPDKNEWKAVQKEAKEKQLLDRKALKTELIDALLDYGVTLAELDDESWVSIAAFLGSGSWGLFGRDGDDDRIVIRVKMRDLRRFMTGSLTREEARAAVVVEGAS